MHAFILLLFFKCLLVAGKSLEFLKFYSDFHVCEKTSTVLQLDDDDDFNFNTLQLFVNKENEYHEINLKNNINIFVFSMKEILFMAECKKIKMITIPDIVSICYKYLYVAYYEDGDPEQKHGFLQKNMIIRKDKQDLEEQSCQTRNDIYTIGNDIISQTGNNKTNKGTLIKFNKSANKQASFASLKKLSETNDYFEQIDNNRIYKIYSILENIITPCLFIINLIKFLFEWCKHEDNSKSIIGNNSCIETEDSIEMSIQTL